jgi:hypothetical protein
MRQSSLDARLQHEAAAAAAQTALGAAHSLALRTEIDRCEARVAALQAAHDEASAEMQRQREECEQRAAAVTERAAEAERWVAAERAAHAQSEEGRRAVEVRGCYT